MNYVPDYQLEPIEDGAVAFCDECNGDLYEGDTVYKIDGDTICEECLADYFDWAKTTAAKGDKNGTY